MMLDNFEFVLTEESLKQGLCQDGWIVLFWAVMAFFMYWLELMIVGL